MSKPKLANPALSISDADLTSALAQIGAEIDHQPLRSSALARIMRETFHGSDAGGAWDWRMAYDLMQAAAIQVLLRGDGAAGDIAAAKLLASRLLTETRRSEQQIRLQQFSTPLAFATMAVRAAAIRKGETVLEPSAGTGALAAFATRDGATLVLNETEPFRQRLLRALFGGEVTGHDGEHIDDLLQTMVLPDVVVMNPPFASSVDRSRDKHIAAKHLIAAAKRLAPGGRLVAIMPPGFTPERDAAHWSRACGLLTPRLALTMPGQVYRKLGTSVETQFMVFDKVQEVGEMIRVPVRDLDEALAYVDAVAATRTEMRPVQQAAVIPNGRPTVPSSAPRKTAAVPVAASKPRANAVRPLSFTSFDVPRDNTPISDIYARYRPQRIEIAGAQEHPTPLVESIAMASVAPPMIDKDGMLLEELPPIQRFLNRVLALPIHMQNALFTEFMRRIADQTERARAAGTLDLGVETLRGEKIEQVSTEDLWTCPKSGAVTRIIGLEVTDSVHVLGDEEAISRNPDKLPMVNRASGRAALISARPMQMYDEDIVTLMRKAVRPNGSSYLEETRFEASAWEEIGKPEFARLWDAEAASLPKTTATKLYLLTGLLLPIWKDIPTTNERIYRVTPDGATAMIGRTLSEEGAAALRARFLVSNPQTPQEMLTAALGTTAPVDLGRGLSLTRRRVAGEVRLELSGADKGMIDGLKALGCFTEIIAFQLRVFLPHGDGVDTGRILARIVGQGPAITADQAA